VIVAVVAALGLIGSRGKDLPVTIFFAAVLAGAAFSWISAVRGARRAERSAEVQKLLALAAGDGTLTPAMIVAGMGMSKDEADAALLMLRESGVAEFDVDEHGTPVYRVAKGALKLSQRKSR